MTEILVYSRNAVETGAAHAVPHVIVSINCPYEDPAAIATNELTLGRVDCHFWDMDRLQDGLTQDDCQIMTADDARRIVATVKAHPEAQRIIVHCTAGKSRSAGVAAALMKAIHGDDSQIFGNKWYHPNMLCYRLTLDAWEETSA